jgi:hypothetical protein
LGEVLENGGDGWREALNDDLLQQEGCEGPEEENGPNHDAEEEILFENMEEVRFQKVAMFSPLNYRLSKENED